MELIYTRWANQLPYSQKDLCEELKMNHWEYKRLKQMLLESEDIIEIEGDTIELTLGGKNKARKYIRERQYLSSFFTDVFQIEETSAEQNAARIQRVASADLLNGIMDFMFRGKVSSRKIRGHDLSLLYDEGRYHFDMCLYTRKQIVPREICEEFCQFSNTVTLMVEQDKSVFLLKKRGEHEEGTLWYLDGQKWKASGEVKENFILPSNAFTYIVEASTPLINGECHIAYVESGQELREQDIRCLEVHLW